MKNTRLMITTAIMMVLTLCMIGLVGCSLGNTDKGNKDTPVPVQGETQAEEKKLTVYDYYNSKEIQETVAELVDMNVFNDNHINTADGLFSLIYNGVGNGSLIDDKCTLIQYQSSEDLWFMDVSSFDIKTSEWLTYIINEKILEKQLT